MLVRSSGQTSMLHQMLVSPIIVGRICLIMMATMLLLCGCASRSVKKEMFTIAYRFDYKSDPFTIYTENFRSSQNFGSVTHTKYTACDEFKVFDGTDVEIEYQKLYNVSINGHRYIRRKNYLIGIKNLSSIKHRAFYITWTNRSSRDHQKADVPHSAYTVDTTTYLHNIPWEIGKYTDSLQSSLSYKEIKRYYPLFNGYYKQVVVDSIIFSNDDGLYTPTIVDNPALYINGKIGLLTFE